jgi:hypothetical protein
MIRLFAVIISAVLILPVAAIGQQPAYSLVLIPLDYGNVVPGAFGSEWSADLWVANHSDQPVSTNYCEVRGCPDWSKSGAIPARQAFQNPMNVYHGREPGVVWFLSPGDPEKLQFNLRLYERSENTVRQGIEIPVVREGEFFTGPLELLNVPSGGSERVALRIYDPDAARRDEAFEPREKFVRLEVLTGEHLREPSVLLDTVLMFPVAHRSLDESALEPAVIELFSLHAMVDLTGRSAVRIRVTPVTEGLRIWAMASVTDNETHYVSIISPQ